MTWPAIVGRVNDRALATFGQTVVFHPPPAEPPGADLTVEAVYGAEFEAIDPDTGALVTADRPELRVRAADIPGVSNEGWRATVNGNPFDVYEIQGSADHGAVATVLLTRRA